MDFENLVGQIVEVEAFYREKLPTKYSFQYKILLGDIFINGVYFRDHTFVKYSKRWCNVPIYSTVRFQAILTKYRHKGKWKIGLRHIRNIQILAPSLVTEAA